MRPVASGEDMGSKRVALRTLAGFRSRLRLKDGSKNTTQCAGSHSPKGMEHISGISEDIRWQCLRWEKCEGKRKLFAREKSKNWRTDDDIRC